MRSTFLLGGMVCALMAGTIAAGQITYYIDETGRRVYINADAPATKPVQKKKKNERHSVLVRRDSKTGRLISVPARPVEVAEEPAKPGSTPAGPADRTKVVDPAPPAVGAASGNAPQRRNSGAEGQGVYRLIQEAATEHSIDPNLLAAIIKAESNFNPGAISNKGAMGLMQLMPQTARAFGAHDPFDPEENISAGVRYLKYLMESYPGQLHLSLAAYNAGPGAVDRYKGVPPYRETRDYVRRIASLYRSGDIGVPFIALAGKAKGDRWGIMKRVDERGRVHFSNTEGW